MPLTKAAIFQMQNSQLTLQEWRAGFSNNTVLDIGDSDELFYESEIVTVNMDRPLVSWINPQWVESLNKYTYDGSVIFTSPVDMTFESLLLFSNPAGVRSSPGIDIGSVSSSNDSITTTEDHGLVEDERIMLKGFSGGSEPEGTSFGIFYYANIVNDTTIKLKETPGGGVVNLTDSGSGSLFLQYCRDQVSFFYTPPANPDPNATFPPFTVKGQQQFRLDIKSTGATT